MLKIRIIQNNYSKLCMLLVILIAMPAMLFAFDKKRARSAIQQPAIAFSEIQSTGGHVQYTLNMTGLLLVVDKGVLHYELYKAERKSGKIVSGTHMVDMHLAGADTNAAIVPEGQVGAVIANPQDHTTTRWVQRLTVKNIYPHIDWVLYIDRGQLVYDFIVHAGADISKIQLAYSGVTNIALQSDGGLTITTPLGDINEEAPKAYQQEDKQTKSCHFVLADNIVTYDVDKYTGTLVINKP